jgi:hypothetical protein
VPYQATVQVVKTGGVSNADIDGNNILQINAIEVAISTFKTLPGWVTDESGIAPSDGRALSS